MSLNETPWLAMALNNAWANATLFGAVQRLAPGAFTARRPGFFDSLAKTLNHIHEVDLYYVDALEKGGLGRSVFDRKRVDDPSELAGLQMQVDMRLAAFCNGITPETLAETRVTDRASGPSDENVSALLLHLIQHQIHHRGQAHVQLSDAGIAPPQLDDFYLKYGRVPSAEAYWA